MSLPVDLQSSLHCQWLRISSAKTKTIIHFCCGFTVPLAGDCQGVTLISCLFPVSPELKVLFLIRPVKRNIKTNNTKVAMCHMYSYAFSSSFMTDILLYYCTYYWVILPQIQGSGVFTITLLFTLNSKHATNEDMSLGERLDVSNHY